MSVKSLDQSLLEQVTNGNKPKRLVTSDQLKPKMWTDRSYGNIRLTKTFAKYENKLWKNRWFYTYHGQKHKNIK